MKVHPNKTEKPQHSKLCQHEFELFPSNANPSVYMTTPMSNIVRNVLDIK